MRKAKDNWINQKYTDIGNCIIMNNTKKVYNIINNLTKQKDNIAVNINDIAGKCIIEKSDIMKRWT